jgi:hypothetical protein
MLNLNGSEPLSGYAITALEGTRNGVTFACSGSSCNVDLLEGQNDFTYWALSSWGDSSTMGSSSGKVDTQPPVINGTLSGTSGDNGWYVSDVTVSASASDGMSGLQSFDINVNGGGYQPYAEVTLGEGTHTVDLRAVDNAGHVSSASQSFSVDTTAPVLALSSGGGSFCPRCGDALSVSYDVQDALSGISGWTLSAGGAVIASSSAAETAIVDWGGSGLGGGTHTLTLTARDAAGNQSTTSLSIILNTPPEPTSVAVIVPRARVVTPFPPRPTAGTPLDTGLAQRQPSRLTFESQPPEPQRALVQPVQSMNSTQPARAQATVPPVLWGGAAAGLIGAAMVVAMEAQRKRKEEEARAIAEMNRINADSRAREKGYQSHADMVEKQRQAAWDAAFLEAVAAEQERKKPTEEAALLVAAEAEQRAKGGSKVHARLAPPVNKFLSSAVVAANTAKLFEEQGELVDPNANWVGIKYKTMGVVTVKEVDVEFPVLTKVAENKWAWRAPVKYVRHDAVVTKITSVKIGNDDPELVQSFFNTMDPMIDINIQKDIYSSCLRDGTIASVKFGSVYGEGRDVWLDYNGEQNAGQYLNLFRLLGEGYPNTYHHNLCGELAVMAALGYDLREGLKIFSEMKFYRKDAKGTTYEITGKVIFENDETTTPNDLKRFINELLEHADIKYSRSVYSETRADFDKTLTDGKPMVALVNLDRNTGLIDLANKDDSDIPHFVTILNVFTNPQGEKVVQIYNPYNNQQEFYNWETFDGAWKETYYRGVLNSQYVYLKPEG